MYSLEPFTQGKMLNTDEQINVLCNVCSKKIQHRHKFVNCSLCRGKIHNKCTNIEYNTFQKMDKRKKISMCLKCNQENFPFYSKRNSNKKTYNQEFLASEDMKTFFKGLNDFNRNQNNPERDSTNDFDITPVIDCKYFDINSFKVQRFNKNNFIMLHLNIGSLEAHKEELEAVLFRLDLNLMLLL